MTHSAFPDPAAVHPGEAALLSAVLADLTDDLPKLVYADWLEERGDPRGVFLRQFTTATRNGGGLPDAAGLSASWLELTGCRAVAMAREHKLPITPDELLRDALPALTFASEPANDADLRIGRSKFGGEPDVPPGFEWPEFADHPLSFLAQFELSALAGSPAYRDLPRDGLLSVFYEVNADVFSNGDVGGWRVFNFPASVPLERRAAHPSLTSDERFRPCSLRFAEVLTIPGDCPFDSDEHSRVYYEIREPLRHQLLGHVHWMQGTPDWAEELAGGRPVNRHLLTIDSDDRAGWMWGDVGLLYFFAPADDLGAGRFDRTLFEFQCG